MKIVCFEIDGSVRPLKDDALATVQKAVGGYVEPVRVPGEPGVTLLVNEEGRLQRLPLNVTASMLAGQTLVGPVVWVEGSPNW